MKAEFFYAKNGVVASAEPGWIQPAFDTLTELFYRVGLRTNTRKTVGVMCRPFQADEVQAYKAYTQRMTGEGRSFK